MDKKHQIDSILEAIIQIAQLDNSKKAIVTSDDSQLNAIAAGVNMLGQQLAIVIKAEKEKSNILNISEELAQLGSWKLDLVKNKLTWSDEVYRIFGLEPQEFEATYEAFLEAVHPDDRNKVNAAYTNSLQEGKEGYEIEHRLLNKKTGKLKFVFEKCLHYRNDAGEIIQSVGFVQDITQRKLSEETILRNKLRLKTAQRTAKIGSWDLDLITGLLTWSEELYRVYNCAPETYKPSQESFILLIHPDYKENMNNWITEAIQGKNPTPLEFKLADGSDKWIRGEGGIVFNEKGIPILLHGIGQDITEKKKAEETLALLNKDLEKKVAERTTELSTTLEKLMEKENGLLEAQRIGKTGSWEMNLATGKLTWSNEMYNIYNCDPKTFELTQESFFNLLPDEFKEPMGNWITKSLSGIVQPPLEFNIPNPDGSIKYILGQGESTIDEMGRPFKMSGTAQDITERKIIEQKILFDRNNLDTVINNTNDLIWSVNLKQELIVGNYAFDESVKQISGAIIPPGNNVYELGFGKYYTELFNGFYKRAFSGESFTEIIQSDSIPVVWSEISIAPIKVEDKIVGAASFARDITERKKNEFLLHETITELGKKYNDLMQFNYIVSHNLRAPIANILGISSIISQPDFKLSNALEFIKHLRSSAIKMDEVISDLNLLLSNRSNLTEKKEAVFITNITNSIFDTLEKQIKDSGTEINMEIGDDANEIFTIKSYIESTFYNLISNAIKYRSKNKKAQLVISSKRMDDKLIVKFIDNGIGIDLKLNKDNIFGLYKRFNNEVEGKGLGLYMTKTQVESFGGEITVESEVNKGTTFTLIIKIK